MKDKQGLLLLGGLGILLLLLINQQPAAPSGSPAPPASGPPAPTPVPVPPPLPVWAPVAPSAVVAVPPAAAAVLAPPIRARLVQGPSPPSAPKLITGYVPALPPYTINPITGAVTVARTGTAVQGPSKSRPAVIYVPNSTGSGTASIVTQPTSLRLIKNLS